MSKTNTAQERFDELYITSSEIQKELGINRSLLARARTRGRLPEPVCVPGVRAFIWEREAAKPYIEAWRISLASHRGELA